MLRFKQYLLIIENRLEHLKGLGQNAGYESTIDHYAEHADPTEGKEYTNKLLSWHKAGIIKPEDAPNLRETLADFHKLKNITGRLPKRDIGAYKTPSEVEDAVVGYAGESGKQKDERVKKEEIKHIHSENGVSIISPTTRDAAQLCSKDAKWCTGAVRNNMFDHYNSKGPLYIMNTPSGRYQYHPATGEFKDVQDRHADLNDISIKHPEIVRGLRKIGLGRDLIANRQELEAKLNDGGMSTVQRVKLIKSHPLVTPEDVTKVLNNPIEQLGVKRAAVQHPTAFTKEHMDDMINNPDKYEGGVFESALGNSPALKEEHVDKLVNDFVNRQNARKNGTGLHFDEENYPLYHALINPHGAVQPHHITTILNNTSGNNSDDDSIRTGAMNSSAVTSDHIDEILNNPHENQYIRDIALRNKALTPKQVTKVMLGNPALSTPQNFYEKTLAIQHPTAVTPDHINMMLNDPQFKHWGGTEDVLKESNAVTSKHIDKIINDPDPEYSHVVGALRNPAATPEHIDSLLDHVVSTGRHTSAAETLFSGQDLDNPSPLIRSRHVDKLIDSLQNPHTITGSLIASSLVNPDVIEPHHIDRLLADTSNSNRFLGAISRSPAITSEHISKIIKGDRVPDSIFVNPKLLPSHVDTILANKGKFNSDNINSIIQHPTAFRPRHIDDVLDNPEKYEPYKEYRDVAMSDTITSLRHEKSLRPRHIDKIIANPDKYVNGEIRTASRHPVATPEQRTKLQHILDNRDHDSNKFADDWDDWRAEDWPEPEEEEEDHH